MNKKALKIMAKASRMTEERTRFKQFIKKVGEKTKRISADHVNLKELINQVQLLMRMLTKYFNGEYNGFSQGTILTLLFGLVYFLTPLDVIPDFIPLVGFSDDLSVIYFIIKNLRKDIAAFNEWEVSQSTTRKNP
jgi:uncharacterized membrane protein YkvA (DUF1232 family)